MEEDHLTGANGPVVEKRGISLQRAHSREPTRGSQSLTYSYVSALKEAIESLHFSLFLGLVQPGYRHT